MKTLIPAAVVAVMSGVLLIAAAPGKGPSQDPPPVATTVVDDPAVQVFDCRETHDKGPCTTVWRGSDGKDHWWYVEIGHTLWDRSARDLGVVEP